MLHSHHRLAALPPLAFMDLPPGTLSEAIRLMEGTRGDFAVPLWRASLAGEFRIACAMPGALLPAKALDVARPPTCIILSGDPDDASATPPPTAFKKVRRYITWAAAIVIHATGGTRETYAAVAATVPRMRRVLLVETGTRQEDAWIALARAEAERREKRGQLLPCLCWSAKVRGGFHPVSEAQT
jgi:hypothetical protein